MIGRESSEGVSDMKCDKTEATEKLIILELMWDQL